VGSTERARANRNQTVGDGPSHGRELKKNQELENQEEDSERRGKIQKLLESG